MDKDELNFILQEGEGQFIEFKENLPKKDFGKASRPRNRLLADLLSRTIFMKKVGTGIKRIRDYCEENNNRVDFKFDEPNFFVEMIPPEEAEKTSEEKWSEKWSELSERQTEIISLIKQNSRITRRELSEKLAINPSAIQKHLEKLKEMGIIKRIGPDKGGYWEVLE